MPLASADCRVLLDLRPKVPCPKSNCFCADRNHWLVCRVICNREHALGTSAFLVGPIHHIRRSGWWRSCYASVWLEAADLGLIECLEVAVPASCAGLIGRARSRPSPQFVPRSTERDQTGQWLIVCRWPVYRSTVYLWSFPHRQSWRCRSRKRRDQKAKTKLRWRFRTALPCA